MSNHYERKWDIVEEIDIELFDGNLVRIQWLEWDSQYDFAPAQIRIHSTAYTNPRRLKRFTKLSHKKDYGVGWEPVILEVLQQVSDRLRETNLDTFDTFITGLFGCFKTFWTDRPDFPVAVSLSELNEFYTEEAIESAVSYFLGAPHDEDWDSDSIADWGDQQAGSDAEEALEEAE
ncbi:MAG: hypothetical protein KF712_04060 [Akkermansiaceae bacterium]|nr:hypothetical protein [Akkermansiaceae bacterium]